MWRICMMLAALTLTACSSTEAQDYAGKKPTFDIREYLNGDLEAWGAVMNMDGSADPQFYVKMKGEWKGNQGTLDEQFTYTSGEKKHRRWTFTMTDDHHFIGTASDVVGEGVGQQYGNAVNMRYILTVPRDGSTIDLSMDDWLYRIDETHVINRTEMRKFGVKVGELVIAFRKL